MGDKFYAEWLENEGTSFSSSSEETSELDIETTASMRGLAVYAIIITDAHSSALSHEILENHTPRCHRYTASATIRTSTLSNLRSQLK